MSNRSGGYSCYTGHNPPQPEIHVIKLHKSTNGMGLSIVAAKVRTPYMTLPDSFRFRASPFSMKNLNDAKRN